MAGTAVLSLFTRKLEKRAFLAAKIETKGYQLTECNIQRRLELCPYFIDLSGVFVFLLVCLSKTEGDWEKPGNTCILVFGKAKF